VTAGILGAVIKYRANDLFSRGVSDI